MLYIIDELAQYRYVALDVETTGGSWLNNKIFGYSIAYGDKTKWFNIEDSQAIPVLNYLFNSEKHRLIGHNFKSDLLFICEQFKLAPKYPINDTMIAAFLINENRKVGLKPLAEEYKLCDLSIYQEVAKKKRGVNNNFSLIDRELMSKYCCIDSSNTLKLFNMFKEEIQRDYSREYLLETQLIPVLIDMERTGVLIDRSYLEEIAPVVKAEMDAAEKAIKETVGYDININSQKQLCKYFYEEQNIPVTKRTDKGAPSLDVNVLKEMTHPVALKLLAYRDLEKTYGTYVTGLLELLDGNNVLHTTYNATDRNKSGKAAIGAVTGRLTSSLPDLQNIPRPKRYKDGREKVNIRRAFITRPGTPTYYIDYHGMELVVGAHFSKCYKMITRLNNNEDLHADMAAQIYNIPINQVTKHPQRDVGKKVNFTIFYGSGAATLANSINKEIEANMFTKEDGYRIKKIFFNTYPEVETYYRVVDKEIQTKGYVKTIFGRKGRIAPQYSYKGPNFIIQGSCADLIKESMVRVFNKYGSGKTILQVHDELQIQNIDNSIAKNISEIMCSIVELKCKLSTEISISHKSWADKEELKELTVL